jgi:hypothetical protein
MDYKENGHPGSWSGDVWGENVVKVSNQQMEDIISGKFIKQEGISYYTSVSWTKTYEEAVYGGRDKIIDGLLNLGGDPNNIRIVYGFDS